MGWRVFSKDKKFLGTVDFIIVKGSTLLGVVDGINITLATFNSENEAKKELEKIFIYFDRFFNLNDLIYDFNKSDDT